MTFLSDAISQLDALCVGGLYEHEEPFTTAQAAHVGVPVGNVINLCASNYLGLADSPELIAAAKGALGCWGFGIASVRFVRSTQIQHLDLEAELARSLRPKAEGFNTILYSSCLDANDGLFEALLGVEDTIISDEPNHAFIVDEAHLSEAARRRYRNQDLGDLHARPEETRGTRHRAITTDGVFSMDGYAALLGEIYALADEYGALVMVDDSHAVGFIGKTGAGIPERFGITERVDTTIGTLDRILGGASGGCTYVHSLIVELLRQRLRSYLFSNSLMSSIIAATLAALGLFGHPGELPDRLCENTAYFRIRMAGEGFEIPKSGHPIVPVTIGDAVPAARTASATLACGVYVRAFSYPTVPKGRARIRTRLSASLTRDDLGAATRAFVEARSEVQ